MLFLLPFFVAVAFVPGIIDPANAPRWALLAAGIPLFWFSPHRHVPKNSAQGWCAAFVAIAGLSLFWSPAPFSGADEFIHLVILAGAFYLGMMLTDLRLFWAGLGAGVSISAALAIAQVVGWTGVEQSSLAPAGLFINKNPLAEAALLALVGCAMTRQWVWVPGCLIACLLPMSLAVVGALALVAGVYLLQRVSWIYCAVLIGAVVAVGFAFISNGHLSATNRVDFWWNALSNLTWFGHGLGSYAADWLWARYAHNEFIQVIYEFGIFAAIPFALAARSLYVGKDESCRLVLVAGLGVACLAFPLHLPVSVLVLGVAAGHLFRGGFGVCNAISDRVVDIKVGHQLSHAVAC